MRKPKYIMPLPQQDETERYSPDHRIREIEDADRTSAELCYDFGRRGFTSKDCSAAIKAMPGLIRRLRL